MRRTVISVLIAVAVIGGAGYAAGVSSAGAPPPSQKPNTLGGQEANVTLDPTGSAGEANTKNAVTTREYTPLAAPCRLYDSRTSGGPLQPGSPRVVPVNACNIPIHATAIDASISTVSPSGPGYLRAWANGTTQPTTTLLQWGTASATTGATVPMSLSGIKVQASAATGVVIDVAGYYSEQIYADVLTASSTQFAEMYSSTGMISGYSSALTSPGRMIVSIRRDITYCDIQATAEATGYTANAVIYSSNSFTVSVVNPAGTAVRAYASVKVTC